MPRESAPRAAKTAAVAATVLPAVVDKAKKTTPKSAKKSTTSNAEDKSAAAEEKPAEEPAQSTVAKAVSEAATPIAQPEAPKRTVKGKGKRTAAELDTETVIASPPAKKPAKAPSTVTGGLAKGVKISDFSLSTHDDKTVQLADIMGKKGVVIFLYPKAATPGCTKQACGFRDRYSEILTAGFNVYGLSADSPKAQTSFVTKNKLPYPLLCDTSYGFIKSIGAFKQPKGIKRSHIVLLKDGTVHDIRIQVGPDESVKTAVECVTSAL